MKNVWICALFLLTLSQHECQEQRLTYKAAVLEHQSVPFKATPLETMLANAVIYGNNAKIAADQGAEIIVFPEYGMLGLGDSPESWTTDETELFLVLPKEADGTIPCLRELNPHNKNDQVLRELSCIARNYSIALVVNQLLIESCNSATAPQCPSTGYFKFNANIIFSQNGTILGRYHKRHLYHEHDLNPAPQPEFEIVDLGFAKFGTFICFDIMFADPTVQYVTQHGIRNLLFSTAWIDELPYLTSPQLFPQFAKGLGINFIASNAYNPPITRLGSGIYSSQIGGISEEYDLATPGRLLVAELPINPEPISNAALNCTFSNTDIPYLPVNHNSSYVPEVFTDLPSSSKNVEKNHKIYYQPLSNFTYLFLESNQGLKTLCEEDLCCKLDYELSNRKASDIYAFAFHNDFRRFDSYVWYEQVCSVLRCESKDIETCGRVPETETEAQFEKLILTGAFATNYTFPSILGTDLLPVPSDKWTFSKGHCKEQSDAFTSAAEISLSAPISQHVLVASIFGRVYEKDPIEQPH